MSGQFVLGNIPILSAAVFSVCCAMLFGLSRKKDALSVPPAPAPQNVVIVPSAVKPIPRSSSEKRDAVMAFVRQTEAYIDRINAGGVREEERKWQNKLRAELDGIKRSVDAGDFVLARRRLSSAEMYAKMLELHMAGR